MASANDRTPLLADRSSERTASYDAVPPEEGQAQGSEFNIDISKKDFIWMLTGLWSM
jgi:hypothetical protein